jgi:gluconolactonase
VRVGRLVTVIVLSAGAVIWAGRVLPAQVPPPPEGTPMTPALERLLEDRQIAAIATGFSYAEGPAWRRDGYLLFADSPRNRIHRLDPRTGQLALYRDPSGIATALAFDREGRLLATEHANRRISRTEPNGTVVTLVDHYQGKRLNSPNDLVVSATGAVFFTDPPYGLPRQVEGKELDFQGVYRLDPDARLTLLVRDMPRPNGIGLSPDGQTLYVSDSERAELKAFPLRTDGTVANARTLANLKPWREGVQGLADGLTVDMQGRVYVAGPGGVWVFDPNGGRLGVIGTPEPPSACTFGGPDGKTLFITARSRVYRIRMKVAGARPAASAKS